MDTSERRATNNGVMQARMDQYVDQMLMFMLLLGLHGHEREESD